MDRARGFYPRDVGSTPTGGTTPLERVKKIRYCASATPKNDMVAMVQRLAQRVVVPLMRVRFPLATP